MTIYGYDDRDDVLHDILLDYLEDDVTSWDIYRRVMQIVDGIRRRSLDDDPRLADKSLALIEHMVGADDVVE